MNIRVSSRAAKRHPLDARANTDGHGTPQPSPAVTGGIKLPFVPPSREQVPADSPGRGAEDPRGKARPAPAPPLAMAPDGTAPVRSGPPPMGSVPGSSPVSGDPVREGTKLEAASAEPKIDPFRREPEPAKLPAPGPHPSLDPILSAVQPASLQATASGPENAALSDSPAPVRPKPSSLPAAQAAAFAPVHRQLAEAVHAGHRRDAIDISLSPEELGRVRLSLHHDPQGLRVEVSAERAETADLIRRHMGDLDRDLRGLGHGSVSFSFGGSPSQSQRDRPVSSPQGIGEGRETLPGTPDPPAPPSRTNPGPGLDIRL
ncbi:flagellar hook-length control protein FliK [Frigidibacter sp. ROC022]|uniref:flagellar hook-length control protein FliK n=1 Tax=Frigidibacter sp. ROC022 TaxID=2971796 RepID=UPI00215A86B8|nr:flagellar hook-length control protein FliK [Frigidibacter sp. ROC022]MCR8724378.1 flagellar hook-length control protein FliK [Frigidibacter sp. ROC022]